MKHSSTSGSFWCSSFSPNTLHFSLPNSDTAGPTALVFFKVISLEVSCSQSVLESDDWDDRAARGDLGAFVDPSATKMIQTGVEHSRVPLGIWSYHGVGK
jgi:hypothetical protein